MKTLRFVFVVFVVCAAGLAVISAPPERPVPDEVRLIQNRTLQPAAGDDALAAKLVYECAGIREGDLVLVTGGVQNYSLLESIAVHARKVGAMPLITVGSDNLTTRMWNEVPEKYDSQTPTLGVKLANMVTAMITVDYRENPQLLAHIPPQRLAAATKAELPVDNALRERNVRRVNLGNGLYPSVALAKQYGMDQQTLAQIFWAGVNTDYKQLKANGASLQRTLTAGRELRITNPNGADLRLRVEGRPVFTSDGVLSPEDMQRGGSATEVWLPAGETYLAPVAGSAQGKIVANHLFYNGKEISDLTITFKDGRVTSMTARSGLEPLRAVYDASGPGKDMLGVIDFGINPDVNIPPGSKMLAWMPAGMVTVMIGGNTWAGGDNDVNFGLPVFMPNSTVTLDGQTIVESGKLRM